MKKEFDLKIDGGTLESIKIDSSNSLIIATYKRDVAEFKVGDILVDCLGPARTWGISIFKCISEKNDNLFDIYALFDAEYNGIINIGESGDEWDYIEDQRLATEEEKQLLFDALKKEGKKWNADKLEIEKIDISDIVVDLKTAIDYLEVEYNQQSDNFINLIKDRSAFDFNVDVDSNDKILTLSTCYSKTDKMVIHAKLIKIEKAD